MNSVRLNNLSLKYLWFTPSGCKDKGYWKFVAKTQILTTNELDTVKFILVYKCLSCQHTIKYVFSLVLKTCTSLHTRNFADNRLHCALYIVHCALYIQICKKKFKFLLIYSDYNKSGIIGTTFWLLNSSSVRSRVRKANC